MKTLLIDNYDSFTFNLYHLIAEVNGEAPLVIHNDEMLWQEARSLPYDNIVISPGPGRPDVDKDFGICRNAILESDVPILGVCLGHQGLCHLYGGEIDYANPVMHGRASDVYHQGTDLLSQIPSPFSVIRYHSLLVSKLSSDFDCLGYTGDDLIMAVRHKNKPLWGVQFHPESISSEYGIQILKNFRELSEQYLLKKNCSLCKKPIYPIKNLDEAKNKSLIYDDVVEYNLRVCCINDYVDPEQVFINFYRDSEPAFWLDSALALDDDNGQARFSFMGDASGPLAEVVTYDLHEQVITIRAKQQERTVKASIFDYLDQNIRRRYTSSPNLPFNFNLGYVGYLGYELKGDCGSTLKHKSKTPEASFIFADRMIAFDHKDQKIYLLCLDQPSNAKGTHEIKACQWLDETKSKLKYLYSRLISDKHLMNGSGEIVNHEHESPIVNYQHDAEAYLELIHKAQAKIKQGETYEVCLTNSLHMKKKIDTLKTYQILRKSNPAPFASYLKFSESTVLSSSPERFITIDEHQSVVSKPIKGTRPRGETPLQDQQIKEDLMSNEKDQSENLMIVDLLRHDLGSVCELGSVKVPKLFSVESYATVHQLVSTISGKLKPNYSAVECVKAAFPGGSMTGAPKKRTMEIIDDLEGGPRGIYSGSIGYFALNGSTDQSIVIRTIVVIGDDISVGVGGAIVDLSNPEEEVAEMMLKSKALLYALSKK